MTIESLRKQVLGATSPPSDITEGARFRTIRSQARREALEDAAKVAEAMRTQPATGSISRIRVRACHDIAAAIRSLKETP